MSSRRLLEISREFQDLQFQRECLATMPSTIRTEQRRKTLDDIGDRMDQLSREGHRLQLRLKLVKRK